MLNKLTSISNIRPSIIFFLFSTLLVAILYANTLKGPFIFDDIPNIVENRSLHWQQPLSFSTFYRSLISHRPISNITFGLNYYFGKLDVKSYHLVNIFLHLLNTVVLFTFLNLLIKLAESELMISQSRYLASAISLLWAASPIQTQSVNYIVQRMTLLACLFYLTGLIAYIKARHSITPRNFYWIFLTFVCGGLALLSKENTVFFPITCLLIDYYFISKFRWNKFKDTFSKSFPFYFFVSVLIIAYIYFHPAINDFFSHRSASQEFTIWERVMTEWRVLVYYFSLLAYPIPDRLSIDYFVPISRNLFQPLSTFFSLILIVASISWSIKNAKKFPFISFGILWFFINLLVESTFIPIDLVFEHRLYLPSIGIFISSVSGISYLFRRWPYPILKGMGMVLFLISLLFESVFTIERNKDWFSQIALWASAVKRSPDSFRAHINLGKAYEDENDLDLAEKEYVRTLELNPNEVLAHNDYGSVLLKKGEIRKAESEFMTAISLNQNLFIARYNLANLHGQLLGPEIGIKETKELLNQFPKLVQGYLYLGELYESSSNPDEARQAYLEANQINPDALEPLNHLGVLCLKLGDYKNAEIYFKEALMVDPNPSQLHQNLGRTYQFQGLPKKALEEYILAYEGNPRNTAIHFNIGSLFLQNGNFETAVAEFEKGAADKATRESLPLLKEALTIIHDPELRTKIENLINKISN